MSCLTCAFDKKKALRKLEASEVGSTLTLPREEEARLLAELARGSTLQNQQLQSQRPSKSSLRDPHCLIAQDFVACVTDEVSVRRGDCVRELFRDGDWTYVSTVNGTNGFVPSSYIKPIALLFNTNPAQEQLRAKTFERNNAARASIDSRRSNTSTSSWGSGVEGSSGSRRKSPSGVSARELWVPPRGNADTPSQNNSRACSPQVPSQYDSSSFYSPNQRAVSPGPGTGRIASNLVVGNMDRPRPLSCTPTHHRRCEDESSERSASPGMHVRPLSRARRSLAAPGEITASRRATSMRNIRVNPGKNSAPLHVKMAYHFEANSPEELSLVKGEEVVVLSTENEWVNVQTRSGLRGRVPKCLTTPVNADKGVPDIQPLPRNLGMTKPMGGKTGRDSIATDITDDSAIATGDECSLGTDSRRCSSIMDHIGHGTSDDGSSPDQGPCIDEGEKYRCGTVSAQYSTTVTRHNSPVPGDESRASRSPLPATSPELAPASPEKRKTSSTRDAMMAQVRAREAVGDKRPRLVVLFDYTALVSDEMDVKSGDIVMENPDRSKPGWAWVTLPRTNQEGYIPLAFTQPYGTDLDDRQVTAL